MSIEDRLAALEAAVFGKGGKSGARKGSKPLTVNIDDPKWGDPEIRYVPKKWDGPSPAGQRMSQCSVRFLDFLAGELARSADWKDNNGKAEHAEWDRRDAAKALAWAERKRSQGEASLDDDTDLF
jgi:hypothetical protein